VSEAERIKERSVDSLQQIYAVVIALAIAQAVLSLLKDPFSGTSIVSGQILIGLPAFVAFLVTLVPFWHGMNRHLGAATTTPNSTPIAQAATG